MKTIIVLVLIAFVAADNEYYVLEKLDMDAIINNFNDLKELTDCLLEKIPCNKVYESYRAKTAEAIQEACKRCSPKDKQMIWKYIQAIKEKLPQEYLECRQKYDPENKFFDAHERELEKA